MPELNWIINDSTPTSLAQEFSASVTEGTWTLNDWGFWQTFSVSASPWTFDFSLALDYYMWTAEAPPVGGGGHRKLLLVGIG